MARALDPTADLDSEQVAAVTAPTGPVCVLAGAGTGKTRAITHRIAHAVRTGETNAGQVLAVTFTARAASEMRGRLRALGVDGAQARTFHAAALRQLRYFAPTVLGGPLPDLLDNKYRLVAQSAARARLGTDRSTVRDLAGEIEWAKTTLVTAADYPASARAAGREPPAEPDRVARAYQEYEDVKARIGLLDFEDLLLVTAAAIEDNPRVAEAVRSQYRYFVVDEYQDVNPLQQRLLDAWLGGRDTLCVVGDPNQTIYSFTGANADFLLGFRRRYPQATVVRLDRDYRSTPQVVRLANRVIGAAPGLRGQRPDGPEPTFTEYQDDPAEAAGVAEACARLAESGVPLREIAILYRANAQSESYERALSDAGIPYTLRGGERFFDRPEIREATGALRGAARTGERQPLAGAVRAVLSGVGWSEGARPAGGAARERWESLTALVEVADELVGYAPDADLADLVMELDRRAAAQHAPTVDGVTLASLHAAKGLEWDAVFLVGLTDGSLPTAHARTDAQVEEERRLLYVGITRARERLSLSWSLAKTPGARASRRRSRFLVPLGAIVPGDSTGADRGPRDTGPCRSCGATLRTAEERKWRRCAACSDTAATDLFETLRAWRRTRAAEQGVPPYVVCADSTLIAIAEGRPRDDRQLLAVPGIGRNKLDQYGAAILSIVSAAGQADESSSD